MRTLHAAWHGVVGTAELHFTQLGLQVHPPALAAAC